MDHTLLKEIIEFDLDAPLSEYGFSTRIAKENYWTINFTKHAILEYKRFMYLAATSDQMVSPSEIIDTVWHEHLIFTQSYSEFCKVLRKDINHIPSTHNRQDFEKFKLAKQRTTKLYESNFGKQPSEIWNYSTMFEPLNLEKFNIKLRTLLLYGLFAFVVLVVPFYIVLKPFYAHINSSYFLPGFMALIIVSIIALEAYNREQLKQVVQAFNKNSFVFKLTPMELVFLKTSDIKNIIHGHVSPLIEKSKIKIVEKFKVTAGEYSSYQSAVEFTILETLQATGTTAYSTLLSLLLAKPVFGNISNALNAFKKYFMKSKAFIKLFSINFMVLAFVFMLGFVRLLTGLAREKPIAMISILLVIGFTSIVIYLFRVCYLLTSKIIPEYYEMSVIPGVSKLEREHWKYFLLGNAALAASFIPVVSYTATSSSVSSDGDSSSSGSGCGSSCSSCGGCGGGD